MFCKNCGSKLDDDAIFCTNCGIKISDITIVKYCKNCGNAVEEDAVFCTSCGSKLKEDVEKTSLDKGIKEKQTDEKETAPIQEQLQESELQSEPIPESEHTSENVQNKEQISEPVTELKPIFKPESVSEQIEIIEDIPAYASVQSETVKETPEVQKSSEVKNQSVGQTKNNKTVNTLFIISLVIIFIALCYLISNRNKQSADTTVPMQTTKIETPWITSDTFNLDLFKPYTFKYSDQWEAYEFDCYNLPEEYFSKLWSNPPKYFVYNGKNYVVDNTDLDHYSIDSLNYEFGDAANTLKKYNLFIEWGDFDGTYYHFDTVFIQKGNEGFALY